MCASFRLGPTGKGSNGPKPVKLIEFDPRAAAYWILILAFAGMTGDSVRR
jgi:hypothetical protein